ncbi:MAG: hypothetical protein HY877_08895 [Deltaproteobacteria bacterium]|nr:hypothetical protein [Deltaproteobacteria bacterium]
MSKDISYDCNGSDLMLVSNPNLRLWTMDHGPWTMDHGLWTMDYGLWTKTKKAVGLWSVVHSPSTGGFLCQRSGSVSSAEAGFTRWTV